MIPPSYKQTKVGVIPEEWEVKELGSVCGTITTGKLDANAMRPDGPYRFYTCAKDYYQIDKFAFDCEALLISGNGAHVGYIHYYHGKFNAYQRTYVLFGFRDDIKFIQHYLSENFKKRIEVEVKAGGTPYITRPTIAETALPVPPLPEQRAIATALSDVDALLAALDRLIAKKRDLKQAAMQQLLTGQTRLPGFKGMWETKRLGNVGTCIRGVSYQGDSDLSPHDTAQTKRLLRSNNVQDSTIVTSDVQFVNEERVSEKQILRKNDILICMANGSKALVGKAGLFQLNDGYAYTFGAFMGCFRNDNNESNSAFVFYLFQTGRYRDFINNLLAGSSINNLSPGSIESLEFIMPELPEQTAIATVLSDMDMELLALEQRRDKTRALKQGMMQELLTGRTRLLASPQKGGRA